jgi:nucleotide-binding universal stress UspA family protein
MRVVCAIGRRGGPELIGRLAAISGGHAECLILHVIDKGPRQDLEDFLRGPLHRRPDHGPPPHEAALDEAEEAAGRAAVEEALAVAQQSGLKAEANVRTGNPERTIVEFAREMQASLIAISGREGEEGLPHVGPVSVGHTARFVIDHAPCDVLLLREKDRSGIL